MASSEQLSDNINQHISKNTKSKADDKEIYQSTLEVKNYLEEKFKSVFQENDLFLEVSKKISFKQMMGIIKQSKIRQNYIEKFDKHTIKPDGGFIFLKSKKIKTYFKVILVSEIKRQGTNNKRMAEGKEKQAIGNAIERLGKNLTGIKTMFNHEKITPFVCFGWGCDFQKNDGFAMSKIFMMNEFYQLNRIYVFKKDGSENNNYFSPTSFYFRLNKWTKNEMIPIMREIAETSLRLYIF